VANAMDRCFGRRYVPRWPHALCQPMLCQIPRPPSSSKPRH
jgi:hypothetical protein